jgi:DNA-binding beta-propeller fold protein YncE
MHPPRAWRRWQYPTLLISIAAAAVALLAAVASSLPAHAERPRAAALELRRIGGFDGGATGAAEITAYDAASRRLFVVNGALGSVDVLDLSDPTAPAKVGEITVGAGEAVNSVAVRRGLVALAVRAATKTDPGTVLLVDAFTLERREAVTVGALPDMLVFTPDGRRLLVANEGEPDGYGQPGSIDPEGSISIVTLGRRGGASTVATADFRAYIGREDELRAQGVRIFGPGANAAQDLEPEYIAIAPGGRTAYVTLQENNAIAVVDIERASVTAILPLGTKDHSLPGMGLDPSDEDAGVDTNSGSPAVRIGPAPVKGMFMPDAIAAYRVRGRTYLVTANEGDAREYDGFEEEVRVRAHCPAGLDPAVFGADAARLLFDSSLGRLRVTTAPNGDRSGKDASGRCTELHAFGARSFSIWSDDGRRVWDSGDALEQLTAALPNAAFNASNDNNNLDARSPAKGPEPEGVVVHRFGSRFYAFVGLERVGGIVVYDITQPTSPSFVGYVNTRDGALGDRGPEGLLVIDAHDSPTGVPLLVVGHETSGTTTIFAIDIAPR